MRFGQLQLPDPRAKGARKMERVMMEPCIVTTMPHWLRPVWARTQVMWDAALAAGVSPEDALIQAMEVAEARLSPGLPAAYRREALESLQRLALRT